MVINLQRIGNFIFPTDFVSRKNFGRDKISVHDLDIVSPRLVARGYSLRIADF